MVPSNCERGNNCNCETCAWFNEQERQLAKLYLVIHTPDEIEVEPIGYSRIPVKKEIDNGNQY